MVRLGKTVGEYGKHFLVLLMILRTVYSQPISELLTSEMKERGGRQGG